MGIKIIAKNRRAHYDYFIHETYEAGLVLLGTEVKSLGAGKAQINEAFVTIDQPGEAWIHQMHIAHYEHGNRHNHPETRKRKLLLHKKEIAAIRDRVQRESLTIIALKVYFKRSHAKVEIGLAKGKKHFDKREAMKAKESDRQIRRAITEHQ